MGFRKMKEVNRICNLLEYSRKEMTVTKLQHPEWGTEEVKPRRVWMFRCMYPGDWNQHHLHSMLNNPGAACFLFPVLNTKENKHKITQLIT